MNTDLGLIFDEDPELYARARQPYPAALFRELDALAGPLAGARVVEIGPGTGQATVGLVAAGAQVTAVEPGTGMAGVLRRTCPTVDVAVTPFEQWAGSSGVWDVVVAFTCWHWLEPGLRTERAARALRPGGALATVVTQHVAGGTDAFFADVQRSYERWDPNTTHGFRQPRAEELPPQTDEVDDSGSFTPAVRRHVTQDVEYTSDQYLLLLSSYANHRALPATDRAALFAEIRTLLDGRYAGSITKRFRYELRVARRRA